MYKFLFLLLYCLLYGLCTAQESVSITDKTTEICLAREYVNLYIDTSSSLSITEILLLENSKKFTEIHAQDLINTNTKHTYWLKFIIKNECLSNKPFRIEMFDFDIGEISFFSFNNTHHTFEETQSGYNLPFRNRQLTHKNVSFLVDMKQGETKTFYMKFKSDTKNVLEPMLRSYDFAFNYSLSEYFLIGLFYGLLILILLYNLIYFLVLRKPYYLLFVFYTFTAGIYFLDQNGTGYQYLWPTFPSLNPYIGHVAIFLSCISLMSFNLNFFKDISPRIIKLFINGIILRCLLFIPQLIYYDQKALNLIDLIFLQVNFFIVYKIYDEDKTSFWFLIAYFAFDMFYLLSFLENVHLIPSSIFTVYAHYIGLIIQFTLMSIGIAETVRETYKQQNITQQKLIVQLEENERLKEKVNRELESLVQQKTKDLEKTKNLLETKNKEINEMNLNLDLDNRQLSKNVSNIAKTSIINGHIDFDHFKEAFPTEFACKQFLFTAKQKTSFICPKCKSKKEIKGKTKFDRRCGLCNYNESLMTNTIFQGNKTSLQKGFYLIHLVMYNNQNLTVIQKAELIDMPISTCQNFRQKIKKRLSELQKANKRNVSWESIIFNSPTK